MSTMVVGEGYGAFALCSCVAVIEPEGGHNPLFSEESLRVTRFSSPRFSRACRPIMMQAQAPSGSLQPPGMSRAGETPDPLHSLHLGSGSYLMPRAFGNFSRSSGNREQGSCWQPAISGFVGAGVSLGLAIFVRSLSVGMCQTLCVLLENITKRKRVS